MLEYLLRKGDFLKNKIWIFTKVYLAKLVLVWHFANAYPRKTCNV